MHGLAYMTHTQELSHVGGHAPYTSQQWWGGGSKRWREDWLQADGVVPREGKYSDPSSATPSFLGAVSAISIVQLAVEWMHGGRSSCHCFVIVPLYPILSLPVYHYPILSLPVYHYPILSLCTIIPYSLSLCTIIPYSPCVPLSHTLPVYHYPILSLTVQELVSKKSSSLVRLGVGKEGVYKLDSKTAKVHTHCGYIIIYKCTDRLNISCTGL